MGKLSYYIAISLDGFIARKDGAVDFLDMYQSPLETPFGYADFFDSVSAVVMGRKTFEVIEHFDSNPYEGKPIYIYSSDKQLWSEWNETKFIQEDVDQHVTGLKSHHQGRIWLSGGGKIARHLMDKKVIDEIVLTVIPITLGEGIPWLASGTMDSYWKLSEHYVTELGIVQLIYRSTTDN